MNRPAPAPFEWTVSALGWGISYSVSPIFEGRYYIRWAHYLPEDIYVYSIIDLCHGIMSPRPLADTPAALVRRAILFGYKLDKHQELYAALASITSNEDWENLNA